MERCCSTCNITAESSYSTGDYVWVKMLPKPKLHDLVVGPHPTGTVSAVLMVISHFVQNEADVWVRALIL